MAGEPRAECRIVSEEVWVRAKADYLNGMTAPMVAKRHGVGIAGLRGRVAREGLTKAGHAAANAPAEVAEPAEPAPLAPDLIARGALKRASAALMAGRPAEAEAIVRALEVVQALAVQVSLEPDRITLEEMMARNRA